MKMFRDVCKKKALTRRYASTSPASGRGEHQLTALLIAPTLMWRFRGLLIVLVAMGRLELPTSAL